MANYNDALQTHFNFSKSKVPKKWSDITWEEVERWLKIEMQIITNNEIAK